MSEFDVNLISAFAKCPAFYDKSNPNFKDRAFTENAWKEISLQLGFDEKVLRDRMFQLRNRYNLEKRKVEMQDGDPNAKSTWPLFDRMSFLEGHIRPRKSYKSIMNRSMENNDQQHGQFGVNPMFFNHHRNNNNNHQQMRQYQGQHPFAVQNAQHNARLQQLANHIQMMASNNDESPIDLNGDSFPGLPSNLAMELALMEGDDRTNPLHLFQQQQQQQLNMQHHQQQLQRQQQFLRRDGGGQNSENGSEIKAEYYSESDDDDDGLRDTETDTTSKSKDDVTAYGQRMTDASSSSQQAAVLGELLNSVVEDGSGTSARNENQSRNGTVSEPGQSTGNDVEEGFLNPMDILMSRQSTGSVQNNSGGGNMRYSEPLKRKENANLDGQSNSHISPQATSFKRRRRNYQNMIPNGMGMQDNGGMRSGGNMMGHQHSQGSNAMLANQAMILAQLQNTLASQQTFLQHQPTTNHQQSNGTSTSCSNNNQSNSHPVPLPDKYTAFGQFLASSLNELNGIRALDLIAKFTLEVVNALREQKGESKEGNSSAGQNQTQRQSPIATGVITTGSSLIPPAAVEVKNHTSSSHNTTNNLNNANNASNLQQPANNINLGEDKYRAHQF